MSKILCVCGASIHDNTDYQENKAYLVPDQSWESIHESIAAGVTSWEPLRGVKRLMYQCTECSRLHVEAPDGSYYSFAPDRETPFGILKAAT